MKRIIGIAIIFSIVALFGITQVKSAYAAGSPLQISPFHSNGSSPCGVFYSPPAYSFSYNGGTVMLSGLSDGTGNIYTDDKIAIEVTRPNGTKAQYSKFYGNGTTIIPTAPQNISFLFQTGNNLVTVKMTDFQGPYCNSSEYWLVETAGGGGGPVIPSKPSMIPRSAWHGPNSGEDVPHNPNHIVIHHARSANNPAFLGAYARELFLAQDLDRPGSNTWRFNPVQVLSRYDSQYPAIRGYWEGNIWLIWARHKLLNNYKDIAYHYIVDPTGRIFEGRWKGSSFENAENKGSSVGNANEGVVGIMVLGRYGMDGGNQEKILTALDGGVAEPTEASLQSVQRLVDWISAKYNISKNGKFQIPPTSRGEESCQLSPDQCFVDNIAGHRDFSSKTLSDATSCPGDNLYKFLPRFRATTQLPGTGQVAVNKAAKGLLIGGFSPIVLGVVDPTGKRLGIDPATGQYLSNIPEGAYGATELFDSGGEQDEEAPYFLTVPDPISGVYKIDVVGTGTGDFTLATEDIITTSAVAMVGNTTNGAKDNYQIIYNTSAPSQLELFHDTVPPATTGTMTCSRDMLGICRSDATLKLSATDTGTNGDPASGVEKIQCSYDNKVTWQQCGTASGGQFVISSNGKTSFWYRSIDRVQNIEVAKYSGIIEVQKYVSIANTLLKSDLATTLKTTGITQSNGNASFTNNTTVNFDILKYIGTFTQSGNTTFTINQNTKVTTPAVLPNYPLSYYKPLCTNFTGPVTLYDTGTVFNKCIYATGDVTLWTSNTSGKLTIISEGFIKDNSTGANIQAWDTKNGLLFYSAKGYTTQANQGTYTGVIYAPTTKIDGSFSNKTLNGSMYSNTVSFGSGTSLTANQAAGFAPTTYNLPL